MILHYQKIIYSYDYQLYGESHGFMMCYLWFPLRSSNHCFYLWLSTGGLIFVAVSKFTNVTPGQNHPVFEAGGGNDAVK